MRRRGIGVSGLCVWWGREGVLCYELGTWEWEVGVVGMLCLGWYECEGVRGTCLGGGGGWVGGCLGRRA